MTDSNELQADWENVSPAIEPSNRAQQIRSDFERLTGAECLVVSEGSSKYCVYHKDDLSSKTVVQDYLNLQTGDVRVCSLPKTLDTLKERINTLTTNTELDRKILLACDAGDPNLFRTPKIFTPEDVIAGCLKDRTRMATFFVDWNRGVLDLERVAHELLLSVPEACRVAFWFVPENSHELFRMSDAVEPSVGRKSGPALLSMWEGLYGPMDARGSQGRRAFNIQHNSAFLAYTFRGWNNGVLNLNRTAAYLKTSVSVIADIACLSILAGGDKVTAEIARLDCDLEAFVTMMDEFLVTREANPDG